MEVTFPGGKKVAADWRGFTIMTDQSVQSGGEGSAPEPFDLFLASLATCAAFYILDFCNTRDLPTDEIRFVQDLKHDPETRRIVKIEQTIMVPAEFPKKYEKALARAASLCAVKRYVETAPEFEIRTVRG